MLGSRSLRPSSAPRPSRLGARLFGPHSTSHQKPTAHPTRPLTRKFHSKISFRCFLYKSTPPRSAQCARRVSFSPIAARIFRVGLKSTPRSLQEWNRRAHVGASSRASVRGAPRGTFGSRAAAFCCGATTVSRRPPRRSLSRRHRRTMPRKSRSRRRRRRTTTTTGGRARGPPRRPQPGRAPP